MPQIDPAQATEDARKLIPVLAAMGVRVVDVSADAIVTELPAAQNANHFGAIYAGSLYTVAEVHGGIIALLFDLPGFVPLVKRSEISFVAMALTDVRATTRLDAAEITRIQEEAREHGKANFVLETEVTDANGVVVARVVGHNQVRRLG